jgi:hypothetical protein
MFNLFFKKIHERKMCLVRCRSRKRKAEEMSRVNA